MHTRGKPLDADVDLSLIARQTSGLTGADLANLCNEAAIFAGRQERTTILPRTSTARWSGSSPACSSGASSPRRRSGSSPTTRPATR